MTEHVGEAVIARLAANGIDTVFGIPGKQTLPLNEAAGVRDDIDVVVPRHETAVPHAAWGYAETSGRPAATVVIPGPGDMNAMNGLKNALNDCTPLIHIAVETDPEVRGGDGIHETPPDTYDNVVKENVLVENPEATVAELERAIAVAMTPPKGPVRVGIPKGFLGQEVALADAGTYARESVTDVPTEDLAAAADLLADADRPVVIAGGGVRSSGTAAATSLVDVAETLGAPVVTTYKGKGVIPEDHGLSAGVLCGATSPDLNTLVAESDVALGVGTDLDAVGTRRWSVPIPDDLIHVTLNPEDIGTGYEPTVGIVADAGATLDALGDALAERVSDPAGGVERARDVRAADRERIEAASRQEPPLTSPAALSVIRDALPEEAVVSVDAGGFRLWTLVCFAAYGPRRYVNPGSWATMGTGLPAALGAQLATPDSDVVALTGDGGLMMCVHELHTAVSEDLPVTIVAFNNADYAIISEEAERSYRLSEGEYAWADAPLDLCAVAEGMGMTAERADTPEEVGAAVADAVAADEPRLVEVPTDPAEPQASVHMRE